MVYSVAPTVAVLAVQGAFIEHERRLEELGCRCVELRQQADLRQPFDRLVLPGGESTAQAKLLHELGMFEALRAHIASGMPVLATCAGLILLAAIIEGSEGAHFGTLPVTVRRNAYGRQLGSFTARSPWLLDGPEAPALPMTFIRAPRIVQADPAVEVLTRVDDTPAAVRYGNQIACAFHPELDGDLRIHRMFVGL